MDRIPPSQILIKINLHTLIIAVCALLCVSPAFAEDMPLEIEGSQTIVAEELIDLVLEKPDLVLIDARIASDLQEGYIEGAINLPNVVTNCETLKGIIESFQTPVAFYCNGVKCERSSESSAIARSCGYTNLYWFRGGIEEWKNKQFPTVYHN